MSHTVLEPSDKSDGRRTLLRRPEMSAFSIAGWLIALAVFVCLVAAVPAAFTWANLSQVMRQVSFIGLMAVGITFVVIAGRLDLSIGSLLSLCAIVSVDAANNLGPIYGAIVGVGVGAAVGAVTGVLIGFLRLNSLVTTLGMLSLLQGAALVYTGGKNLLVTDEGGGFAFWGRSYILGIPTPVMALLITALIFAFVLRRTTFGRKVFAVGGGEEASRFSGIHPPLVIFGCYLLSGIMTGFASVIFASRVMAARSDSGAGLELVVLSGVILGGVSLTGGRGGVIRALIGVVVLALIQNILLIVGLPYYTQWLFIWAIIIVAVWIDLSSKRKRFFL